MTLNQDARPEEEPSTAIVWWDLSDSHLYRKDASPTAIVDAIRRIILNKVVVV